MKKPAALLVALCLLLCLAGCGGPSVAEDGPAAQQKSSLSMPQKEKTMVSFTQENVAIASFPEKADSPQAVLLESRAQLDTFYRENRNAYGLDGPVQGRESAFLVAVRSCDDGFFEKNSLLLLFTLEGSGGVVYGVEELVDDGTTLQVTLQRTPPEGMAAAVMVYSCFVLRLEGQFPARQPEVTLQEK